MKSEDGEPKKHGTTTVKRFHQFVRIEKGPVYSAIINFLEGEFFQVPNDVIDKFNAGNYTDIEEFMVTVEKEKLVIDVKPHHWIPDIGMDPNQELEDFMEVFIELHVEEGISIEKILNAFQGQALHKLYYYGKELPKQFRDHPTIEIKEKSFDSCIERASVNGEFYNIQESTIQFNKHKNSCWGSVIAFTSDGKIRPCIHSQIEIGDIERDLDDTDILFEKMEPYWRYNKDKVQRCQDCEFRYVCFDCREIAMRKSGEMDAFNPLCNYNPYTGEWEEKSEV
jgi:radical SAM protein with 4Fe4S-binding SPASM domain